MTLYGGGIFLSQDGIRALRRSLLALGAGMQTLRTLTGPEGFFGWQIRPKVHIAQHFDLQAQLGINPRWCQNYTEESAIGSTTRVWKRSATGKYRAVIQRLVLLKRLVALAIR